MPSITKQLFYANDVLFSISELDCGSGVYHRMGPACPATCSSPNAPNECPYADTEVCLCPDGLFFEDDDCIPPAECGCIDEQGQRHEVYLSNSSSHGRVHLFAKYQHCIAISQLKLITISALGCGHPMDLTLTLL